jgi:hypothetical protein
MIYPLSGHDDKEQQKVDLYYKAMHALSVQHQQIYPVTCNGANSNIRNSERHKKFEDLSGYDYEEKYFVRYDTVQSDRHKHTFWRKFPPASSRFYLFSLFRGSLFNDAVSK